MLAQYFSIIQNYVLSVSLQRKYNIYHQNALLDAFQKNSHNTIGRNPSMVIPLLAIKILRLWFLPVVFHTASLVEKTQRNGNSPSEFKKYHV